MPSNKLKPSEVAADTKRNYIPLIKQQYASTCPTHSYLFQQPLLQLELNSFVHLAPPGPPEFSIRSGDPVDYTIEWERSVGTRIPFICAANDKRPGGDWETNVVGYEERVCRRSTLSATLSTPAADSGVETNYPIPSEGAIFSEFVVVFRGPHDQYQKLEQDQWMDLPVVSIPAARWPKLSHGGYSYAFPLERDLVRNKMRAALRICTYYNYNSVVIGDFGLGNGYRNPPQELAELWREVFLWDPELRGKFRYVAFCFEDQYQSTTKLIADDIARKSKKGGSSSGSSSKGKSKASSSSGSSSSAAGMTPSDLEIFEQVFHPDEILRVMSQPDPRLDINSMLIS